MNTRPTLVLDGRTVGIEPGDTLMTLARREDVYVPHLCYHPALPPGSNCRLCVVEVNGVLHTACNTAAEPGSTVVTQSERLHVMRRGLLQLLFTEGNHICPACERSGDCELQALAYREKMLDPHFTPVFPVFAIDASHPDVILDRNRCIHCQLCVHASKVLDGKSVFAMSGRGHNASLVVQTDSGQLGDSTLEASDAAAQICPVGALMPRQGAWRQPIGERRYDRAPIDEAGDNNTLPTEVADV